MNTLERTLIEKAGYALGWQNITVRIVERAAI